MNKWDYIIKKIIIRTRHHDHHCYCHHVIMIIMMIMTRIMRRECTMLREGRSRFFVRSWRGWRNSRSHPTKKHRIYTEYTQKILWRTIGNRQNRMLRIIGWTWSSSSSSSLSVIIIIDIIIVIIITIVFESVNKQNTEIYGASLWECGQAKHRDILRGWRFGHSQPTKKHRMYRIYMIYRMYRIYRIYRMYRIPDPKTLFLTEGGAARRGLKAPQVIDYVRKVWNGREDLQKLS